FFNRPSAPTFSSPSLHDALPISVLFITVYTGMGLNTDITKGLYDRFRSLPMWQASPLFGALVGDVFRYSVASVIILLIGLLLGLDRKSTRLNSSHVKSSYCVFCL